MKKKKKNSGATRVRVHRAKRKSKTEDSSYPKGLEILLKETTVQTPRTSTIPKLRLKIMTFANLNEFWNSKTRFLDTTKRSMSFLEAGVPRSWQTNCQTDDWDNKEEMHEATVWQSHFSWQ